MRMEALCKTLSVGTKLTSSAFCLKLGGVFETDSYNLEYNLTGLTPQLGLTGLRSRRSNLQQIRSQRNCWPSLLSSLSFLLKSRSNYLKSLKLNLLISLFIYKILRRKKEWQEGIGLWIPKYSIGISTFNSHLQVQIIQIFVLFRLQFMLEPFKQTSLKYIQREDSETFSK